MSFASPAFFLGLLVLPLLIAGYLAMQRQRKAAAAAFSSPAMAASVAPRTPGWRRHAPMVALAVALIALIVALAKPQTTVAVPAEKASIMLVTDVSGSMLSTDVKPNRLTAVRRAAQAFVDKVPSKVNVGVLAFNQTPTLLQSPTTNREEISDAITRLTASGGTATGDALQTALRALGVTANQAPNASRPPAAIVLITDGVSKRGTDPVAVARQAGAAKVPIYTVALGTAEGTIRVRTSDGRVEVHKVPPDPSTLRTIAQVSKGQAFEAGDAAKLDAVYKNLGSKLGKKNEKREISSAFAGGGLALLLLGAAMSLGWHGRLV